MMCITRQSMRLHSNRRGCGACRTTESVILAFVLAHCLQGRGSNAGLSPLRPSTAGGWKSVPGLSAAAPSSPPPVSALPPGSGGADNWHAQLASFNASQGAGALMAPAQYVLAAVGPGGGTTAPVPVHPDAAPVPTRQAAPGGFLPEAQPLHPTGKTWSLPGVVVPEARAKPEL
jgi:hypothetical protein